MATAMLYVALGAILIGPPVEKGSMLPNSLKPGALAACAPSTVEAAEQCLAGALSAEDLAVLKDRISARRFRPDLDCAIEIAWKLGEFKSPMAKVMRGKLGIHDPGFAVGMIISDLQVRSTGTTDFLDLVRKSMRGSRPGQPTSTCAEQITPSSAVSVPNGH